MSGQNFFKKVHVSERKKIFSDLAIAGGYFFCRKDDVMYTFQAIQYFEDNKTLQAKIHHSEDGFDFGDALFQFEVEKNQYYFSTTITRERDSFYTVHVDTDLFLLQRRSSARLSIPKSYSAILKIQKVNDRTADLEARVVDVSSGGVKVCLVGTGYIPKTGDVLGGSMRLGNRTPIEMSAEVRFVADGEGSNNEKHFGLKFLGVNSIFENKMMTILMNIHSEFRKQKKAVEDKKLIQKKRAK